MQIISRTHNNGVILELAGRFDFSTHRDFRGAYESALAENIGSLDINMSGVDYLDSSALGMLLILKERASARNIQLSLSGCKGSVKQILEIANFNKLFTIS